MEKKVFGLIGYPLSHSFSKKYFNEKFQKEGIENTVYQNFEIDNITLFKNVVKEENLIGLNVTIPYKQEVIPFLDELHPAAKKIGAVNVIKLKDGKLIGYNSDYYGFINSLKKLVKGSLQHKKALLLGTGGASKAVKVALEDEGVSVQYVSRNKSEGIISYTDLNKEIIEVSDIIVNCSPLGMYPKVDACPDIPYSFINSKHILYDLVYNPEETLFMKKGKENGAVVSNGLEMLVLQAEKAWEIWNE